MCLLDHHKVVMHQEKEKYFKLRLAAMPDGDGWFTKNQKALAKKLSTESRDSTTLGANFVKDAPPSSLRKRQKC